MKTASVCLYYNGECKAAEFIEDDLLNFGYDGSVHYNQFIEGSPFIKLEKDAFYALELLERSVVYLTNELDVRLTDESGNYLTAII